MRDLVKEVKNTFTCAVAASGNPKCAHDFQDERYGKNKRVFINLNPNGTNSAGNTRRCTVCNTASK